MIVRTHAQGSALDYGGGRQLFDDTRRLAWLLAWLMGYGLLARHEHVRRPDGSFGPAWVLRRPFVLGIAEAIACDADAQPMTAIDSAMAAHPGNWS